jgi:hypothetical protein
VLVPRLAGERGSKPKVELLNSDESVVALRVGGSLVVFSRDGERVRRFGLQSADRLEGWVMDAAPGAEYTLAGRKCKASGEGVVAATWPRGSHVFGR